MFKISTVRKFQDHKAFPCHLAKNHLTGQLPPDFIPFSELLARARTRSFKQNDYGFACNVIAKLASFEGMNSGYYCNFKRSALSRKNNENEDMYVMQDGIITCKKHELEEVIRRIENEFFDKYKIRIKLDLNKNSQKCESFSFLRDEVLTKNDKSI